MGKSKEELIKVENGSIPDEIVKEDPKKTDWSKLTVAQRFDLSVKRAIREVSIK